MSLTKTQIDAFIDRTVKSNSVSYKPADKTADENLALDNAFSIIFQVGGTWQFDDSNHTDNPSIMTNLVPGKRQYNFTTDEQGNLVLDIYKVMVMNEADVYEEIYPVDMETQPGMDGFFDGKNTQGSMFRYNKTANGIYLDQVPATARIKGLKVFISREGSYFSETDTTKKPGIAGLFHEYIGLRPAYQYAMRNSLKNTEQIKRDMLEMEQAMRKHYRDRSKDETLTLQAAEIDFI